MNWLSRIAQSEYLEAYKIVGFDGKRAFSLYETSKTVDITVGSMDHNIYLGTSKPFVLAYYTGLTDEQDLLLTYRFTRENILQGSTEGEGEIFVDSAQLTNVEPVT
jgi:hypothetical protein